MSPTAEIKIKRYPEGWALHATWANDAGERRAIVRYRLGDAELVDETRTAVELIALTTLKPAACQCAHAMSDGWGHLCEQGATA